MASPCLASWSVGQATTAAPKAARASGALAYLMNGGQVIFHMESVAMEILKFQ